MDDVLVKLVVLVMLWQILLCWLLGGSDGCDGSVDVVVLVLVVLLGVLFGCVVIEVWFGFGYVVQVLIDSMCEVIEVDLLCGCLVVQVQDVVVLIDVLYCIVGGLGMFGVDVLVVQVQVLMVQVKEVGMLVVEVLLVVFECQFCDYLQVLQVQ